MRNRVTTSTYISRAAFASLTSLGLLIAVYAMVVLAPPLHAQALIDESINDSFNFEFTNQSQEQYCTVIVNQFNNASAGDAVAADDAVAETAAVVNAPVNVVQNCLQAEGDIIIGSGDNDGNDDEIVDPDPDPADPADPGGGGDPSTGSCEGGREVARLDSSGDTPDFEVTGEFILVEGNYDAGQFGIGLDIDLFDENGDLVDFTSIDEEGEFETRFNVRPDVYYISAESFGGSFDLVAFDCASGTSDGGTPPPAQSRESSVIHGTYDPQQVLAKTGGSTEAMVSASPVSAGLISGGALLVLCGAVLAFWVGRAGFAGRDGH